MTGPGLLSKTNQIKHLLLLLMRAMEKRLLALFVVLLCSLREGELPPSVLPTSQSLDCLCLFLAVWVTSILVVRGRRNAKIKDLTRNALYMFGNKTQYHYRILQQSLFMLKKAAARCTNLIRCNQVWRWMGVLFDAHCLVAALCRLFSQQTF